MTTSPSEPRLVELTQVTGKWGQRHYELPDGRKLPSVTTILQVVGKPELINWAAKAERELVVEAAATLYEDAPSAPKMTRAGFVNTLLERLGKTRAHQKQVQKAQDIGSGVHALIEWNLRREMGQKVGPEPAIHPAGALALQGYEAWRHESNLQPFWAEQPVWHPTEGYAGTMDLYAVVGIRSLEGEMKRTVIDFKTAKAIYPEHVLQIAAYAKAVDAMGHGPIEAGIIVRFPKLESEPEFQVHEVTDLERPYRAFLQAKGLWEWLRGEKGNAAA